MSKKASLGTQIVVKEQDVSQALVEAKRGRGRPTPYKPEYCQDAIMLCKQGATNFELAEYFGVNRSTLYQWSVRHPDFAEACKLGKEVADDRVERSLYERAVGFTYKAQRPFLGKDGTPVVVEHDVYVPPDVKACLVWLQNRRTEVWHRPVYTIQAAPAQAVINGVTVDEV